jgi:predicted regulator of Ras-like GTPase activity (Roadblock/LC7/MglB family)
MSPHILLLFTQRGIPEWFRENVTIPRPMRIWAEKSPPGRSGSLLQTSLTYGKLLEVFSHCRPIWMKEMTKTRTELMVDRLQDMRAASPDIEASAVVSVDGLIIASALPADVEEDRVSAMSAAMLSLGDRIASELGRGALEQVYIRGDQGFVILTAVGEEAVLTALASKDAKLGLVFLEMRRAAEDLERLVG